MELAAHWHRCQNLPKKRVNTSLLYRERDDPVKDGLANWRTRSGTLGSVEERYTGTLHGRTSKILATWQKKIGNSVNFGDSNSSADWQDSLSAPVTTS